MSALLVQRAILSTTHGAVQDVAVVEDEPRSGRLLARLRRHRLASALGHCEHDVRYSGSPSRYPEGLNEVCIGVATFGYVIYLLRVNEPHRTRHLNRLSDAGDDGVDLLDAYHEALKALGAGYHRDPKVSEGYRVKRAELKGRSIEIKINKGPEGGTGEVYHRDDETSLETGESQSLLSGLRAFIVVPKDCYYGLLFVERIGSRHLRKLIEETVLKPAGREANVVTRIEAFAETADWRTELAPQQTLRVTELLVARSSGEDASTIEDRTVRIEVGRGVVRQVSEKVKSLIVDRQAEAERDLDTSVRHAELLRLRRAGGNAFTVADAAELETTAAELEAFKAGKNIDDDLVTTLKEAVPVDTENLDHKRWEVGLGRQDQVERNFLIESDAVPQLVYVLGGRLTDTGLLDTWKRHAESLLLHRGVRLPRRWDQS